MPCSSYLVVACYILYVIKFGNLLLLSLLSLLLFYVLSLIIPLMLIQVVFAISQLQYFPQHRNTALSTMGRLFQE